VGLGGPPLLERGRAVLVDDQVSVVRVVGIGLRGLRGQPSLQLGPEPGRAGGQPHLGAERRQQPGALLRAEQLVGPVRVRLRPGHRDVASAQLLGEVSQHARLQMAAHEHPRALPVADRPPPVLGGERHVQLPHHRLAGGVGQQPAVVVAGRDAVGDVVTGQRRELPHVVQRFKDAAVGAGGLQLQRPGHGQHRRAVPTEVPGHQRRVVIAVVGRDPVDGGVLPGEPAG
jgi:hypothetical protein